MSKCSAGSCGISCPGTCGCAGEGDNCLCDCYPVTQAGAGVDAAGGAGPVTSGAGVVADRPLDVDFKDFPLAALAAAFVPEGMRDGVCIPVAVADTAVTRAERGVGLAELLRSLGLRLTG